MSESDKLYKSFSYIYIFQFSSVILNLYTDKNVCATNLYVCVTNLFVTITAESHTSYTVRSCVRVRVTGIANRALCIVPDSFFVVHKSTFVSLWICAYYSVVVKVTFHANRVSSRGTVTGLTGLDISSCKVRVQSAAAINAECFKVWFKVILRSNSRQCISAVLVTGRTELFGIVTGLALKSLVICVEPVRVQII